MNKNKSNQSSNDEESIDFIPVEYYNPEHWKGKILSKISSVSESSDTTRFSSAVAGAGSGLLGALAVSPLDVVKARRQVQSLNEFSHHRYHGTLSSLRLIYREEGIPGYFRGLPPALLGYVPSWSIYFCLYGYFKENCGESPTMGCTIMSAVNAGFVTNVVTNPFWVVRTRLQVQDHVGKRTEYNGTIDCFRKIYRQEGIRAFYKGLTASILGLSHVAIQFPLYEFLKTEFVYEYDESKFRHMVSLIGASALSKVVATICTYPHDIARSRLHVEKHSKRNVIQEIWNIIRTDGFLGLYEGMGTQIIRVTPACAITFTSYEFIFRYINNY